jgi:hypothetical protein
MVGFEIIHEPKYGTSKEEVINVSSYLLQSISVHPNVGGGVESRTLTSRGPYEMFSNKL